ncbi:MAG: four helix bundle protein [Chitinophagaceae bacterium]|nr:four helix bundle protein [Chitinophagaceae bacterium]
MFLDLGHTKLKVYKQSRRFVVEAYKLANALPPDEKFAMVQQIKRAALSVHLNIAEGSSRKSVVERKRFYEISRGSIIEVDAAMDIADDLAYLEKFDVSALGTEMVEVFKLVSGLINAE